MAAEEHCTTLLKFAEPAQAFLLKVGVTHSQGFVNYENLAVNMCNY
jgi:hypothetical protein